MSSSSSSSSNISSSSSSSSKSAIVPITEDETMNKLNELLSFQPYDDIQPISPLPKNVKTILDDEIEIMKLALAKKMEEKKIEDEKIEQKRIEDEKQKKIDEENQKKIEEQKKIDDQKSKKSPIITRKMPKQNLYSHSSVSPPKKNPVDVRHKTHNKPTSSSVSSRDPPRSAPSTTSTKKKMGRPIKRKIEDDFNLKPEDQDPFYFSQATLADKELIMDLLDTHGHIPFMECIVKSSNLLANELLTNISNLTNYTSAIGEFARAYKKFIDIEKQYFYTKHPSQKSSKRRKTSESDEDYDP